MIQSSRASVVIVIVCKRASAVSSDKRVVRKTVALDCDFSSHTMRASTVRLVKNSVCERSKERPHDRFALRRLCSPPVRRRAASVSQSI